MQYGKTRTRLAVNSLKTNGHREKSAKPWTKLLVKLAVIALIVLVASIFLRVHVIHDNYMYPRISDGDLIITCKTGSLYTGDTIVYEVEGKKYAGRVAAVGGDTIDFNDKGYTVNGIKPHEAIFYKTEEVKSDIQYPYTLADHEVYVLCDYREQGTDSRTFGPVTDIKGKVVTLLRIRGF